MALSLTVMEEGDADRMLAELVRITKPGGRVAAIVRGDDCPALVTASLRAEVQAKAARAVGAGVVERGCADAGLYRRFHVLDCSCGIGTQAIGLARLGYRVKGTDISERSLERARVEAARLGIDIAFLACDFRDLNPVEGAFDAVISCDNAIPHLLTDEDLSQAFRAMRSKLRPGGLLLISVRDYDKALVDRPATATPQINPGPPRKVLVRLHDWDSPDSPMYTVHFLVLTEGPAGWTVAHHSSRYRAVGRATLTRFSGGPLRFWSVRFSKGCGLAACCRSGRDTSRGQ